jgi:putative FmdB family regulatory protein
MDVKRWRRGPGGCKKLMPTYQYRCSNCSHEFEEYQSIKAVPLVSCPHCKQDRLQRVIGSGSVIFKGSGFYQTDYKGGNSAKKESTDNKKPETKKEEPSSDKTKTSETKSDKPSSTDTNNKAAS